MDNKKKPLQRPLISQNGHLFICSFAYWFFNQRLDSCTFFRAWHPLHDFPRLQPVACFPALGTVTHTRFPALGTRCMFSRPRQRFHIFASSSDRLILENCKLVQEKDPGNVRCWENRYKKKNLGKYNWCFNSIQILLLLVRKKLLLTV